MKNYDIIVIGAGCGGLSAAAFAAKEGKKVLLLEKHNSPGGFATSFVRGRFEFELSVSRLTQFGDTQFTGEALELLKELNIEKKPELCIIPDFGRIISGFNGGEITDVKLPFGKEAYIDAVENYCRGSRESLNRLFDIAEEIERSLKAFSNLASDSSQKDLKNFIKENKTFAKVSSYSVEEVLDSIDMPIGARRITEAFWHYFGIDCERLNFIQFIHEFYNAVVNGCHIPKNRSYAIPLALAGYVEDNGGDIRYNCPVSRILFKNQKACGVILKSGERIFCDHIICSASPSTAYSKMIKSSSVPGSAIKRTNARSFGSRGACVYIGLNRSPEELGIKDYLTVITESLDSKTEFLKMRAIDTNNNQTAVCLNIANPDCSPQGTSILVMNILYTDNCWANVEPKDYFSAKDMLAARAVANYEKATGITIHNNIEELEVATPVTFARFTGTPQGTVLGYLPLPWDDVISRMMTEESDSDTEGLRFCGGWGTLGSGISSVIENGRNAAYATICDIENEKEDNDV